MPNISVISDPSNLTAFQSDMAAMERDIVNHRMEHEAEMLRLQREDDTRCTGCGDPTEGAKICGVHVQICPACIAKFIECESRRLRVA